MQRSLAWVIALLRVFFVRSSFAKMPSSSTSSSAAVTTASTTTAPASHFTTNTTTTTTTTAAAAVTTMLPPSPSSVTNVYNDTYTIIGCTVGGAVLFVALVCHCRRQSQLRTAKMGHPLLGDHSHRCFDRASSSTMDNLLGRSEGRSVDDTPHEGSSLGFDEPQTVTILNHHTHHTSLDEARSLGAQAAASANSTVCPKPHESSGDNSKDRTLQHGDAENGSHGSGRSSSDSASGDTTHVVAKFSFTPSFASQPGGTRAHDILSFEKGDVITVTSKDTSGGWWKGVLGGQEGIFPSNYCEPVARGRGTSLHASLVGEAGRLHQQRGSAALSVQYSVEQMEAATGCFCAERQIDQGAFGIVYRGVLESGNEVAVKVLRIPASDRRSSPDNGNDNDNRSGTHEAQPAAPQKYSPEATFRREAEVLGRLRHPNIVALIGHCIGAGVKRPCLVYEFMAGGSLKQRLNPSARKSAPLLWPDRMQFAADIARGLTFLHTLPDNIVHQDVKTANILIAAATDDCPCQVAKLADFGTVRTTRKLTDATHVQTENIVGTRPYWAPEYFQQGHVSVKTDAYAFGVVVLEVLTGRRVIDPHTKVALATKLGPVLDDPDKLLRPELDSRAGRWPHQAVQEARKLAVIASQLLEPRPHRRVTVQNVLMQMEALAAGHRQGN